MPISQSSVSSVASWNEIRTTPLFFLSLPTVPPRVTAITSRNSFALWGLEFMVSFRETNADPPINPSSLKWRFQNFGSTNSSTLINNADPRYTFSLNRQNLTITNIKLSDAGRYTLTAHNPAGISMDFVNLTVFGNLNFLFV